MERELWRNSASELAGLIRAKEVSSREVVDAHLNRIDEVNGGLNAVTVVLADEARAAADAADAAIGPDPLGPLHGVPFTIKENIDIVGSATTEGVPALAEALPPVDAPVVERMKAAGAVPLARTNLPEMGLRITTDNPLRGRTLNPWDATVTAGGSSGGEGVALATGMSAIGLGNDLGGSLRNPAYCCGITSLKPTRGRVPAASSIPPIDLPLSAQLMAVQGPMARRVEDLRLGLAVLAGRHGRDPLSVDAPLEGPMPASRVAALVTAIPGVELPASTVDAVRRAGGHLEAAGWTVVEQAPPELDLVTDLWCRVLSFDVLAMRPMLAPIMSDAAIGLLDLLVADFPPDDPPPQLVQLERHRLERVWSEFFDEHPIVVSPTWAKEPFLHDADVQGDASVTIDRLRSITPGNLLGLPSCAVPTGVVDGLPTGVQVYADRWREDLSLAGAEVIEAAEPPITPMDPCTS